MGQEYIYEEISTKNQIIEHKNLNTYSQIYNILEHLNLNILCYAEEVNDLIDKYLSNLKCKVELKIGACIYNILSSKNIPCQLNRISGLVSSNINDTKKLFKLIKIFPQENN